MSIFFDPEDNFQAYRRNLPHRRQAGVIYFVTFHLADSLPTKKLAAWEKEKDLWLALNPPPRNSRQIEEYHRNFSRSIQKWLDAGGGGHLAILHSWKSFSANQINKASGSLGRVWHQESFDYIVRSPAQLAHFEEYIRKNPNSLPFGKRANKE